MQDNQTPPQLGSIDTMTLKEKLDEHLADETVLLADGFDDAFVGIGRQFSITFAVYDRQKCIEILTAQGMSEDEAEEHFQFNIEGAYAGENTPAFLETLT
jgi:hypothetical protein